jgi:hypothetical protein
MARARRLRKIDGHEEEDRGEEAYANAAFMRPVLPDAVILIVGAEADSAHRGDQASGSTSRKAGLRRRTGA